MNNAPSSGAGRQEWLLGALLALLVLSVQLPGIKRPFSGHFASYQCVMAAMGRNMVQENFKEILIPKVDLLIDGGRGWHLNQYPFPSLAAAVAVKFSAGSFEFWGRFQAIASNLLSILLCGLIGARLGGRALGWASALLYGLSPFSLVYGQTFMSEAMALAGLLAAFYFYIFSWEKGRWHYGWLTLSALALSFAITGRIHYILLGPLFAAGLFRRPNPWKAALLFGCVSLLMPLLWYGFTYTASIHSTHVMTNIFIQKAERPMEAILYYLSPGFLYRMGDVLGQRLMTPLIWPLFFAGIWILRTAKSRFFFLLGGLAANLLLIFLLPQKVTAHDFYLASLPPFLAWIAAGACARALEQWPVLRRTPVILLFVGLYFLTSLRYAWGPVFKPQDDIGRVLSAAQFVQAKTQPEDKIIIFSRAPALLGYYANRPHWTMESGGLGGKLVYYLRDTGFSQRDAKAVEEEEAAMKDYASWLEYYHGKGARYFAAPAEELDRAAELKAHLDQTASRLSLAGASFYLYKLS